jgi:hypothetical protein
MRLQDGVTPVHWATSKGSDTIVEILVKAGADVNVADKVRVIFSACVCVPRRLCILIHGTHNVLFLLAHAIVGRCYARSLGHQQRQRNDCGDTG